MYGSELNQVWTNLLDNAIGALGEDGTITITTRRDRTASSVDIADDGPGSRGGRARTSSIRSSPPRPSAAAPAWASTPRGASSRAPRRLPPSTPAETARSSMSGCLDGPKTTHDGCTHLDHDRDHRAARGGRRLRGLPGTGGVWLHLRICLDCGHVGCCDDSPNRHASAHARASEHPLIRSLEPGEDWCWCFVDEIGMMHPQVTGQTRIPPSPMLSGLNSASAAASTRSSL